MCSLLYFNEDVRDATSVKCLMHFTQALKFSEVVDPDNGGERLTGLEEYLGHHNDTIR